MTDEIEYSTYETLIMAERGMICINIYRQTGAFDWTLEIERTWKSKNRIISWPNTFLSDKAALDAAKNKLMDMDMTSDEWEEFAVSAGELEEFVRKKGRGLRRAES